MTRFCQKSVFFLENDHYLGIRSKIGNRQFQIGNRRTEFGKKNRQPVGPILRKPVAYKKKKGVEPPLLTSKNK